MFPTFSMNTKKTIIHFKSIFYENKKLSFITCHLLLKIVSLHTIAYFYKIRYVYNGFCYEIATWGHIHSKSNK